VVWSQGTPIAWYLNDRTDEGFPVGDYYKYDRVTSRHQNKIGAALAIVGPHPRVTPGERRRGIRQGWFRARSRRVQRDLRCTAPESGSLRAPR
jgi:hypothetical protein